MTPSPQLATRKRPKGTRSRWSIASRAVAALPGGYALAALLASALALLSSAPREEAIAAAVLPAFAVQILAALWSFWASTAARAWLGIGIPAIFLALLVWFLRSSSAAA
jgi:hypothetical protein